MTGLDEQDRELDDFLARRSVLHRRLADRDYHEPSQELDRLVLDKARQAIEVPASASLYRAPRWALPVALAASVVLALAVVLNVARVHGGGSGYPVAASASPAAEAAPGFAGDTKPLPMAPPAAGAELAKQSSRAFAPEPRIDSADADPALSEPVVTAEAKRDTGTEADRTHDARLASNAPVSSASAPAAKSSARSTIQMPAEVHAASDASAVASAAGGAPPMSPPPAAGNSSARFARADVSSEGRVVPAREIALRTADAEVNEAGAARRDRKEAPAPAAAAPMSSDKPQHKDAQSWMREIEQLRLAGKSADADREITAFRKAFPTLPVSPAALGRDPRPTK